MFVSSLITVFVRPEVLSPERYPVVVVPSLVSRWQRLLSAGANGAIPAGDSWRQSTADVNEEQAQGSLRVFSSD